MTIQMSAFDAVENETGVVIPAYLPEGVDSGAWDVMLRDTVEAFSRQVREAGRVCVVVDGPGPGGKLAEAIGRERGVQVISHARNRGKLGALRSGMLRLLEEEKLRYLAAADQDGDHFANELVNLVRAAQHVEKATATRDVMVLGRRISRHRPMGFLRGELEELADRMQLDALFYNASVTGKPLALEFATTIEEFPDFHSGYKLFSRATAEKVFTPEPELAGVSEDAYYRHSVEAVISVEAIVGGAHLAVVNRSTMDEQPMTTFGLLNRVQMIADTIIWPCKRLNVPGAFVEQWLRNHLPRILLATHAPEGRQELLAIRKLVLEAFGVPTREDEPIVRPEFI